MSYRVLLPLVHMQLRLGRLTPLRINPLGGPVHAAVQLHAELEEGYRIEKFRNDLESQEALVRQKTGFFESGLRLTGEVSSGALHFSRLCHSHGEADASYRCMLTCRPALMGNSASCTQHVAPHPAPAAPQPAAAAPQPPGCGNGEVQRA